MKGNGQEMFVGGVVVPIVRREISQLKTWLRYCPSTGVSGKTIIFSLDTVWSDKDREIVLGSFARSVFSREGFRCFFVDCGLDEDESFYIKDPRSAIDLKKHPYGHKSGPNMQFFRSIRMAKELVNGGGLILTEVDAFPVREGWMKTLNSELKKIGADVLIFGAVYAGESRLSDKIGNHFNGNSIYMIHNNGFDRFLDGWEELLKKGNKVVPHLAYDFVIPWYIGHKKINKRVGEIDSDDIQYVVKMFEESCSDASDLIVNYGGQVESERGYCLDVVKFLRDHPNCIITHGKCFIPKISILRMMIRTERLVAVNVEADLISSGDYEDSLLFGVQSCDTVNIINSMVDIISDDQVDLISNEWSG